jgi:pyruvate dehydrogenase E2 component (dihydrolipoamide acetyltransferase)
MQEFKLPSLGADMDEGTLVEWRIKPGDTVKRGDIVAVVDTSKAAIDVESWQEGTVQELRVQAGDKFPVGAIMAILSGGDETQAANSAAPRATAAASSKPTPARQVPAPAAETTSVTPQKVEKPRARATAPQARQRITPAARKRANELGIEIARLHGRGPEGSVTLADVEALRDIEAPTVVETVPAGTTRDRGADMRKTIAAAMSRSKREIPHYYLAETILLNKTQDWLREWNTARPVTERLLLSALLLKAVARALHKYPQLNGFHVDGEFKPASEVHIGVAIALRSGGLIAPALLDVNTKPLGELMQALNDLVQRARAGSLRSSELGSATITVTNLGEQSVEDVFGVIYPPQVALVGFGGVRQQVVAVEDCVKIMPVLRASLAADHRVSDGLVGARFLQHLAILLQDPANLAMEEGI